MKKLIIIIVGVILLAEANPVQPATLEVRAPGGIGTLGDVYTNIQQAIDDASPGDTINVAAGVYDGNTVGPEGHLIIDKANLTLKSAAGKDSTTIKVANGVGIDIRGGAANFVLGGASGQGFTIAGKSDTTFVIQLANAPSGVAISHNTIDSTGNASMGVSIGAGGAADLTISENDFTADASDGCIWAPRVVDFTVSDNTFDGGAYAIQTNGVTSNSQSLISGNEITNATGSGGIVIGSGEGTSDLTISDNTITGCTNHGIYLADYCAQGTAGDMTTVTVEDNTLSSNDKGIRITDGAHVLASNFTIQNNCITGNTTCGLQNQHTSELVNAELNAWGDASGPYHSVRNTSGQGDVVLGDVEIYPWYPDCNFVTPISKRVHNITIDAYYDDIQPAVDEASLGDVIEADAGTYDEQVIIDTGLTLRGVGDTTIIEPSAATIENMNTYDYLSKKFAPVVYVSAASAVTIQDLKIDGSQASTLPAGTQNYVGLFLVGTDATIDTVTSVDFLNYPGSMLGYNMYAYANSQTVAVEIDTCTMSGVGRGGIQCVGDGLTMNIHDCNVTGPGVRTTGEWIANGILIWDLATGEITDNNVSDFAYDGTGWCAAGIDATGATSATGNTVTDCQCGIGAWGYGSDNPSVTISDNTISATGLVGSEGDGVSGITVDAWGGNSASATISSNNLSGGGPGNAITLGGEYDDPDAIDATISGNTITNWDIGIFLGDSSDEITITDNTLSSTSTGSVGIKIPSTTTVTNIPINCNTIAGNQAYGVDNDAPSTVDAELNWWGDTSGPSGAGGGSGDAVSANVDFFPWLFSTDCNDSTGIVADFVVDDDWAPLPLYTQVFVGSIDYYIGLNAFDTIQGAVDAASDGNSISVADGNYVGAVLDKDVTLIGANPAESVISTGVPYKAGSGLLTAFRLDGGADGAEIRNFVLDCNRNDSFFFAVFSRNANDVVIDSLTVNKPVQGISNWGGSNWQITNNQLNETEAAGGGGIAILVGANAGYPTAQGNVIKNNMMTPAATAPDFTCPAVCLCLDLRYGGYESMTGNEDVSYNQISKNEIIGTGLGNEVGVEVGVIGVSDDPNKIAATLGMVHDNLVTANIIDNTDLGVYLYTVTDMAVLGNEIVDCNDAIHIEDSHKNLHVNYNAIIASKTYGLNNAGGIEVDAEYNWWGDVSGPNDPCGTSETDGATCYDTEDIKNANGLGDAVTDNADYCPWLLAPISTSVYSYMPGDLDYDGDVDWRDFAIFAENWLEGTTP